MFEHKKAMYPTIPFLLGSYKFSRVKKVAEFVKELEYFRFGEMNFHRNDSHNKVADYCKEARIHFEYTDFWEKDEETFRNVKNITTLKKRFKQKITTMGGKEKLRKRLRN